MLLGVPVEDAHGVDNDVEASLPDDPLEQGRVHRVPGDRLHEADPPPAEAHHVVAALLEVERDHVPRHAGSAQDEEPPCAASDSRPSRASPTYSAVLTFSTVAATSSRSVLWEV